MEINFPFLNKIKSLSPQKSRLILLLGLGIILKSLTIIFWDIGSVSFLLSHNRFFAIGVDLMGAGCLVSILGFRLWNVDRTKGYGSVRLVLWLFIAMTGLLVYADTQRSSVVSDFIFMFKYVLTPTLTILFWAVSKRFIKEQFKSLKFLSLFCFDLLGMGFAGLFGIYYHLSPMGLLLASLFCLIGFSVVLKLLTLLSPRHRDYYMQRADGIKDVFEKPLVSSIFTITFLGTFAHVLSEVILYAQIIKTGISPSIVLGILWILFGSIGLIMVAILYHTRYIYTTLTGMLLLGSSIIITGIASYTGHSGPIATGYLMFLVWSHFYFNNYLRILPRVLTGGIGPRLKKRSLTLIIPLAFILCGTFSLNIAGPFLPLILTGTGIFFILAIFLSTSLYSQILYRMFNMRIWRQGPLIISYPRLLKYVEHLLTHSNSDDVIYALRILENANHPILEPQLLKAISHPSIPVRRFAAIQLRESRHLKSYTEFLKKAFMKEKHYKVQNEILTDLILSEKNIDKYVSYLNNRMLQSGTVMGFFAINQFTNAIPTLEKMFIDKDRDTLIAALRIVQNYPHPHWTHAVQNLLKHSEIDVVRQAILAAGSLQSPQLLPYLLRALDDPQLQEATEIAMRAYAKIIFPALEKALTNPDTPQDRRKKITLFLGSLPSGEGKLILLRSLKTENQKIRKCIIQNLIDSNIVWTDLHKKEFLHHCLKRDIDRISWLIHIREKYHQSPTHEAEEAFFFFNRALMEDIIDTREVILYQLLLLEPNELYARAIHILLDDTYELYLPAMGTIQDMIPSYLYQKLKPVLVLPLSRHRKEFMSNLSVDEAAQGLKEVIIDPPFVLNHWIRATALYVLRRLMSKKGIPIAEAALSDLHPVVLEAAVWTLVRLEPDRGVLHQKLLSLPTSQLAALSLDKILES